jgi:hypothetical protein
MHDLVAQARPTAAVHIAMACMPLVLHQTIHTVHLWWPCCPSCVVTCTPVAQRALCTNHHQPAATMLLPAHTPNQQQPAEQDWPFAIALVLTTHLATRAAAQHRLLSLLSYSTRCHPLCHCITDGRCHLDGPASCSRLVRSFAVTRCEAALPAARLVEPLEQTHSQLTTLNPQRMVLP